MSVFAAAHGLLALKGAFTPRAPSPIFEALASLHKPIVQEIPDEEGDILIYDDTSSDSTISSGWDIEEEEVEPLPSSVYTNSPPRAPTPPPTTVSDFDGDWTEDLCHLANSSQDHDDESGARRSSHYQEEEHTVMTPYFLTADWDGDDVFPACRNPNLVENHFGCPRGLQPWSFAQWAHHWRNTSYYKQPGWIVPDDVYTYQNLDMVPYENDPTSFFCQKVISNESNNIRTNRFTDRLAEDLVFHSRSGIPLIPTGENLDINAKFTVEMIFENHCQYFVITLMDENEGRKMQVEISVYDAEIKMTTMVNARRMNHSYNDRNLYENDERKGWWDIENAW
jgi:hypothetical protein